MFNQYQYLCTVSSLFSSYAFLLLYTLSYTFSSHPFYRFFITKYPKRDKPFFSVCPFLFFLYFLLCFYLNNYFTYKYFAFASRIICAALFTISISSSINDGSGSLTPPSSRLSLIFKIALITAYIFP